MKQTVRYSLFTIPGKYKAEMRITVDDRGAEYSSSYEGNKNINITFYPVISLNIIRPSEMDENGNKVKPLWNPNDSLGMTKFNLPRFKNALKQIRKNLETPELYTYQGKRLEINEALAEKIRDPFKVGNVTVELSAVVVVQPDETRVEGIKVKFNNEQSSVLLTLNELDSMISNLDDLNIDSLALLLYLNYLKSPNPPKIFDNNTLKTNVDIIPKDDFV